MAEFVSHVIGSAIGDLIVLAGLYLAGFRVIRK